MRTHLKLGLLLAVVALAALAALTACGGGGGEEEPAATTPAGETPTQAPTVEPPTPTPEGRTPAAAASPTARINWCDLVTPEEADEALGEFVRATASVNGYCNWQTDSGIYLRIEPGSPEDLQAGAEMEGVAGEPVPGIGEEAAWFDGVRVPSHHWEFEEEEIVTLGVLSLRQGDVYLRIMLNLPEVDSSTQLEIAKDLAAKALERLP
jgi:predicted small lipoprotein YifL